MDRVTTYDCIARCYKILPDRSVNIVQRLGVLEDMLEKVQHGVMDAEMIDELIKTTIERLEA